MLLGPFACGAPPIGGYAGRLLRLCRGDWSGSHPVYPPLESYLYDGTVGTCVRMITERHCGESFEQRVCLLL